MVLVLVLVLVAFDETTPAGKVEATGLVVEMEMAVVVEAAARVGLERLHATDRGGIRSKIRLTANSSCTWTIRKKLTTM